MSVDQLGGTLGQEGKPLRGQLVEICQANAAGRYKHSGDSHDAPLDPSFSGAGRYLTDDGWYRFQTVKPGSYAWGNHNKCLSAESHPLLPLRPRLRRAPRHPDGHSQRSTVRARPDLQLDPRRNGAGAVDQPVRSRVDPTRRDARKMLRHCAVYCGVPAANGAFAIAQRVLEDTGVDEAGT